MPIYLYRCRNCGVESDRHHSFDSSVEDLCECGGDLRRVYSVGGVTFKGNGFYRTDSANAGS